MLAGVLPVAGGVFCTTGLCTDGAGVAVFGAAGVLTEGGCLGCTVIDRRAAMRSTIELRVALLFTDVSGADNRGVARLLVLLWPPIELEGPSNEDDSFRGAVNTVSDRGRLEGAHRVLKSRAGSRLGDGAATDGADPLGPIVAGGLLGVADGREGAIERGALGVNDGREGAAERGALGVNDGREGATERGALGVNDGLEGAIEGDLPELNGEPWLRDDPILGLGLGLGLIASRLAPTLRIAALRSEAACDGRVPHDPITRAAVSTTDVTAALRFFLSPATNIGVSFPSSGSRRFDQPFSPPAPYAYSRGAATQDNTSKY